MYYLIYKITNKINGKFYIGAHRTENKSDDYMGSGLLISRAIEKYGIENFEKKILLECSSQEEMFAAEKQLVVVDPSISYNLKMGGYGGWDHITPELAARGRNKGHITTRQLLKQNTSLKDKFTENVKRGKQEYIKKTGRLPFEGEKHNEVTKQLIGQKNSINQKGIKNSQYGTIWIHNPTLQQNKKILKTENIPDGWNKGRKMKKNLTTET